jgi:hypothetical protein
MLRSHSVSKFIFVHAIPRVVESVLQVLTVDIPCPLASATKAIKTCNDELFNSRLQGYRPSCTETNAPVFPVDVANPRSSAPYRCSASCISYAIGRLSWPQICSDHGVGGRDIT